MLVLSRLVNQEVVIVVPPSDEEKRISVRLCEIRDGEKARLGFTADADVEINRWEIQEEIDAANKVQET